jgi:RNA-binding protein
MLTGKQKRFLRSLGHDLRPVVLIGKSELTDTLISEADTALEHHELIKVKLLDTSLLDRHEAARQLAADLKADIAQILGRTFLLYRKSREPRISLPRSGKSPLSETKPPEMTR